MRTTSLYLRIGTQKVVCAQETYTFTSAIHVHLSTVIITTGAVSISEMIKINDTLQYLNINTNPIGDEGIAAIAGTLNNSRISELIMYNCNITVTGQSTIGLIS